MVRPARRGQPQEHLPRTLDVSESHEADCPIELGLWEEAALREDFRRRALAAGATLFIAAALTLVTALRDAPLMRVGLLFSQRAIPVHLLTGAFAVIALWALFTRRWRPARVAVAAQATCILWGWAAAQYPYLLPPDLTVVDAAAPAVTLRLVLVTLLLGAMVLLPSLRYLFRVFKAE